MTDKEKLNKIAKIIERVESRCMAADGPVTPTTSEMTEGELREIYQLAAFADPGGTDG